MNINRILTLTFTILACFSVQAQNFVTTLSDTEAPSPIDFRVGYWGDIQIWRDGGTFGQLYSPTASRNGACGSCWVMFNGIYMNVGSDVIVSYNYALSGFTDYWNGGTSGVSAVSGSGTAADPWRISATYESTLTTGYEVEMVYLYIDGTEYIDVEMTVTTPASNNQNVNVYHIMDTYLNFSDFGPAFVQGTSPYNVVGVQRADSSLFEAFVVTEDPWDRFSSHDYFDVLNEPYNDGQLSNTLDTDPNTDNAIAVQWSLGRAKRTQPTIRYRIGFTENITNVTESCDRILINPHIPVFPQH